jgi:hypothetical protein
MLSNLSPVLTKSFPSKARPQLNSGILTRYKMRCNGVLNYNNIVLKLGLLCLYNIQSVKNVFLLGVLNHPKQSIPLSKLLWGLLQTILILPRCFKYEV